MRFKKTTIAVSILLIIALSYLAYLFFSLDAEVAKIREYRFPKATQILDRKERLIANVFENELRFYVNLSDIPPQIIEALLATEDTLFFEHGGVNLDAISRAFIKNLAHGKYIEGGSTLTQQLTKNLALTRDKTISRKIKEMMIAIHAERVLSKEEILERYLNHTFFGHGYHGIKTAALGYFKKELDALSLKEIAILVGLPKAPSFYDPTKNLERSLERANKILDRLLEIGWITQKAHATATAEVPRIYDESLSQNKAPYVVDEALKQLSSAIPDIRTGGYKIKLFVDLDYQLLAQESLKKGYEQLKERLIKVHPKQFKALYDDPNYDDLLNGAMVVTHNETGQILALVGGINYAKSPFNRATQTKRQFGSSVKPFVYQSALNRGYSPATQIADVARVFHKSEVDKSENALLVDVSALETNAENNATDEEADLWKPKNYAQNFTGLVSLKDALRRSLNLATLNLVEQVGFNPIYRDMQRFGFTQAPKDMSVVLGSFGISPLEAAQAYSMFSNYGTQLAPRLVESVMLPEVGGEKKYKEIDTQSLAKDGILVVLKDAQGNVVERNIEESSVDSRVLDSKIGAAENRSLETRADAKNGVIDPAQAYLMIDILRSVVESGTGQRAKVKDLEIAGKTGTSNKNVDAWFCAFSPEIQVVVWYGRDDNTAIGPTESGGVVTGGVVSQFFSKALRINPAMAKKFPIPEGVFKKSFNGTEFYYTQISKLPTNAPAAQSEELIF